MTTTYKYSENTVQFGFFRQIQFNTTRVKWQQTKQYAQHMGTMQMWYNLAFNRSGQGFHCPGHSSDNHKYTYNRFTTGMPKLDPWKNIQTCLKHSSSMSPSPTSQNAWTPAYSILQGNNTARELTH